MKRAAGPLDQWLHPSRVLTRHAVELPVAPAAALKLLLATPVAPDRLTRLLFALRGLHRRGPISEAMPAGGFVVLEHTPLTYVLGLIVQHGRRRPVASRAEWPPTTEPRMLRLAAAFWAEPTQSGSRLTTETRVDGHGGTWLAFRGYWLVVRPFSGLVRRRWLRAAQRRARLRELS